MKPYCCGNKDKSWQRNCLMETPRIKDSEVFGAVIETGAAYCKDRRVSKM